MLRIKKWMVESLRYLRPGGGEIHLASGTEQWREKSFNQFWGRLCILNPGLCDPEYRMRLSVGEFKRWMRRAYDCSQENAAADMEKLSKEFLSGFDR